jgi:hypothetical protein
MCCNGRWWRLDCLLDTVNHFLLRRRYSRRLCWRHTVQDGREKRTGTNAHRRGVLTVEASVRYHNAMKSTETLRRLISVNAARSYPGEAYRSEYTGRSHSSSAWSRGAATAPLSTTERYYVVFDRGDLSARHWGSHGPRLDGGWHWLTRAMAATAVLPIPPPSLGPVSTPAALMASSP